MGIKREISNKEKESSRKRSIRKQSKRTELLGESYSTAYNKLQRKVLFELVKNLEENICHRCKEEIKTIEDFSIEHKTQWVDSENPKISFYDIDNIAYSHRRCNSRNEGKQHFRGYINKTGLMGVTELKRKSGYRYRATIKKDGKKYNLGTFATKEEAAKIYDQKAIEFRGEDTITNKALRLIEY